MPYLDKQVDILTRFGRVVDTESNDSFFFQQVSRASIQRLNHRRILRRVWVSLQDLNQCAGLLKIWVQVFFVRGVKETAWHGGPGFKDRVQVQASSLKSKSDSLSRGLSDSSLLGVQATDDKSESDSWGFRFVSTSSVAKSKSRYRSWTQVVFPWP